MKLSTVLLTAFLLSISVTNVSASTTAQEDAVQKLVIILEQRDLTIQELKAEHTQLAVANLDLVIANLSLQDQNKLLKEALAIKAREIDKLKKKYQLELYSKATSIKLGAIEQIRVVIKNLDSKLKEAQK